MISKLMILACTLALSAGAYNGPLAGGQPAAQFPAGIDPKSCPNFPDCSSPLVALSQATSLPGVQYDPVQQYGHYQQPAQQVPRQYNPVPQQQYNSIPQYNPQPQQQFAPQQYHAPQQQPQYAPQPAQPKYSPEIQNALDRGEYIGDGDYHGEGLAESQAVGPIPNNAALQARAYQPSAPAQYQHQQPQYQPQPQHQAQPQYQGQPQFRENVHRGPAHQFPAGVDGRACPNYPFCS